VQNFGSIIERLECRRNIVSALSYIGHSQPEIARILHVDIGTIDRDLRYLRQQSKENIGKKVEHYHVAVSSDIPGLKSSIEFNLTKEEVEDKIVKRTYLEDK
jgi:NADH/NAD ratio-sensing transcriptional regulator Rex